MNIELRTPPEDQPESWQGKPPAWALAPAPKPRTRRALGSSLTREQVELDVDGARRVGHTHMHVVVPLTRRPRTESQGSYKTPRIRLWGHTGPWSCVTRMTEKVDGGWSGWFALHDVERWLAEHPGVEP